MGRRISFSKAGILGLPLPTANGQVHYLDPEMDHHYVRITDTGVRRFVVKKNDSKRGLFSLTLGPAGTDQLTAVQSRRLASIALGLHAEGYTTDQIRLRLEQADGEVVPSDALTLQQCLTQYVTERRRNLAERTMTDYQKLVDYHFSDWKNRPLEVIDEDEVVKRFTGIDSPSRANAAFRVLRAMYRYARSIRNAEGKPAVDRNPVDVLSQRRLWHKVPRRKDVVKMTAMKAWWGAVKKLTDAGEGATRDDDGTFAEGNRAFNSDPETTRDYLQFLVLTGLRRSEAARLRWEDVDLRDKTFTVKVTKNNDPHCLPLTDFLLEMLKRRIKQRSADPVRAAFVFPGETGPFGEPKKLISKVVAKSRVPFSCHTLRRTFATVAEGQDISYLALKRLLNHRSSDVTGGYTIIDTERLREPMQKITDVVLKSAGERKSADVAKLEKKSIQA